MIPDVLCLVPLSFTPRREVRPYHALFVTIDHGIRYNML